MKVGFIGLGAMGLPMAKRLVAAGHQLHILRHRNPAPVEELAREGARVLASPAEVARAAEVVVTILPADAELLEVALGENGLKDGFSRGKCLVEMTTATPFTVQTIARQLEPMGVGVLDAPVSGGTTGAAEGTLTIMVGGQRSLLEGYRPLLQLFGTNINHVGPVGQGKAVKLVNQLLVAINLLAIGEAFALGARMGADPRTMYEVIRTASGHSRIMDARVPGFLLAGSFEPGFKLDLMKKDLNLVLDSARQLGVPALFAALASQIFAAASQSGRGEMDFAAAADFLCQLSGVALAERRGN